MATARIHHPASNHEDGTPKVNRREFLYYLLGGSAALLATGTCGTISWSMLPRARFGHELFHVTPQMIPVPNDAPFWFRNGRYWLSNNQAGLLALFGECPRDQTYYKWNELNWRFECPDCGSKFKLNGGYIEGPVRREPARFTIYVTTAEGKFQTPPDGSPINIENAQEIIVDTTSKILGRYLFNEGTV
jgi:hypothetical protein